MNNQWMKRAAGAALTAVVTVGMLAGCGSASGSASAGGGKILYTVCDNQCHLVNQFQIKIQWFSFRESHCFFSSKT